VVVLEKGSEPGAHILSGAIMDPRALTELFPDWKERGAPLNAAGHRRRNDVPGREVVVPHAQLPAARVLPEPRQLHRQPGQRHALAGQQAEALGVEIFPGFAAAEVLYNDDGSVKGVATGNMGVGKDGEPTENFQLGMELHAKYTVFAEGARGHLGKQLIARFKLDAGSDPQTYGIGVKEAVGDRPASATSPASCCTPPAGRWTTTPMAARFLYHFEDNKVALGFITGLDYSNPYLSPFEEFQRWKTHPNIRWYLEGDEAKGIKPGKRWAMARAPSRPAACCRCPSCVFPGGALVGCDAGFLNVSRIKGSHAAIKTGMLAAEAAFDAVGAGRQHDELTAYPEAFERSWLHAELNKARNFKPGSRRA
jgi:electron-transferring-flavoprotein dehydrogenase